MNITGSANLTGGVTSVGSVATVVTNANLTGDVTSVGNATTLTNAPVIAKVLTGYTSGAGTVAATDSILQAIQKLNGNAGTNANLTGVITSVGNATSIASQTGTGTKFVVDTGPTMSNPIVGTQTQLDGSTKAASTAYVDLAVSNAVAGVNPAVAVQAATTAASNTSSFTYLNGVSGIGATLTSGSTNTALTVDGYTFTAINQRLLVKNDTQSPSGAYNGVYFVSQIQALGLPIILTRALDYDTSSDINNTGAIPVINGTSNGTTMWVISSTVSTVGTDPLTYTEFSRNPADFVLTSSLGSGVATFLGTPSSANLATAVTDETGSGLLVFATSPSLTSPLLGVPTSGVLTNCTGTASGLTAGTCTTIPSLSGEATSSSNAITLTNSAVIGKVLTGYTSGAGTVAATDTILQAIQKLNGNDATNANLTGNVTSVGNATTIANLAVTNAMIAATTIDLTAKVTGLLPIANGGTNASSAASALTNLAAAGTAINNTFSLAQRFAFTTLTDAATIAVDLSLSNNYTLVLGGNRTLGTPTNPVAGQSGAINVRQDITGTRTLAYAWPYVFVGGAAPTLSTGKLVFDQLMYMVNVYSTSTVTVTIAAPGVMTWTAHGLSSGQRIQLTTTGALPTGLAVSTTYWVTVIDANNFDLSTSLANAQAATFITTTGSQSGTHTATAFSITLTINPAVA